MFFEKTKPGRRFLNSKPLKTGGDRGALSSSQAQQSNHVPLSLVCLLARTRRNVCQTHTTTRFRGRTQTPPIRLLNTEEICSTNCLLFKAPCGHFVMASSICCAERVTDLVSVRVGILSWPRRRGGGASLALDVERKSERLEGRMGRERDGQREVTAAAPAAPNPLAVSAVYLRRPGGVIVLHRRAAEEETHTGNKPVLNL